MGNIFNRVRKGLIIIKEYHQIKYIYSKLAAENEDVKATNHVLALMGAIVDSIRPQRKS